ncbi:MAG: cell division protein ZapA [Burkholderiaceae bacterium]|nr:cell division protein ZapA [Burkholderiaceae bacterium]
MKQIEVRILQQSYLLTCPEGRESRLLDAVERVDSAMVRIRDSGKVRARERIAVLAALNLAFEIADREACDLAAASAKKAAASDPAPASHTDTDLQAQDMQQLHALVARLDEALGDKSSESSESSDLSELSELSQEISLGDHRQGGPASDPMEGGDPRSI